MSRSLDDPRRHVQVLPERIGAVADGEFPGHYPGEDHSWNLQRFQDNLVVSVQRLTPSTIEFDLVGVDASIANALRRVLVAEVPTMAIDRVYVLNNTSIMQDEVLAHRIGLIPLHLDPKAFVRRDPSNPANDSDTVIFDLRVRCDRRPDSKDQTDPKLRYYDSDVYSGMLVPALAGNQHVRFANDLPRPVQPDVLLTKLRPGQVVDLHCFAHKGIGKEHAKFSPVATASYRLLPHIMIRQPIPRKDQQLFQKCFPAGVIAIEKDAQGEPQCVVKNPRKDTVSREVLRHSQFEGKVQLSRIRDHFLFNIESAGQYAPQNLISEAIDILLAKITDVEKGLDELFSADGTAA